MTETPLQSILARYRATAQTEKEEGTSAEEYQVSARITFNDYWT